MNLDRIVETPIGKLTESNWNLIVWMLGYLDEEQWIDAFSTHSGLDEEVNLEDIQALVNGINERYSVEPTEKLQKMLDLTSWTESY